MAKRYSDYKLLDTCFSPIKVYRGDRSFVVPCGKCSACRLGRANDWSMRLGSEISATPYTIWFTLTYNNKYLPTLKRKVSDGKVVYYSDHSDNIRFDGKRDVLRVDDIEIVSGAVLTTPEIEKLNDSSRTSYLSKRDIQLFYKNLRKLLYETFEGNKGVCDYSLRYYCIGEYGSNTLRAHSHHLVFVQEKVVADFLMSKGLYTCWKMCDRTLFDKYCSLTGDGVRNYVTQYVTSFASLPSIYSDKSVRPFRLASKSPSIGFSEFDEQKIFEDVLRGIVYYDKTVSRIGAKYLLRYPKSFLSRLFPRCYRFGEKPYHLLLSTYGLLWQNVVRKGFSYDLVSKRLREHRHALDYYAQKRCYEVCLRYGWHPDTFVWFIDRVYYLIDIDNLAKWYEWQVSKANDGKFGEIFLSYTNIGELCRKPCLSEGEKYALYNFLISFGFDYDFFMAHYESVISSFRNSQDIESYRSDLEDILYNMDKSNRVNELAKVSPTNNPYIY